VVQREQAPPGQVLFVAGRPEHQAPHSTAAIGRAWEPALTGFQRRAAIDGVLASPAPDVARYLAQGFNASG
jgi:hypothetical protein